MAERVAEEVLQYIDACVPVGTHLADQLLLLFAIAGGGFYLTMKPALHTITNSEVIQLFLNVVIDIKQMNANAWRITIHQ